MLAVEVDHLEGELGHVHAVHFRPGESAGILDLFGIVLGRAEPVFHFKNGIDVVGALGSPFADEDDAQSLGLDARLFENLALDAVLEQFVLFREAAGDGPVAAAGIFRPLDQEELVALGYDAARGNRIAVPEDEAAAGLGADLARDVLDFLGDEFGAAFGAEFIHN